MKTRATKSVTSLFLVLRWGAVLQIKLYWCRVHCASTLVCSNWQWQWCATHSGKPSCSHGAMATRTLYHQILSEDGDLLLCWEAITYCNEEGPKNYVFQDDFMSKPPSRPILSLTFFFASDRQITSNLKNKFWTSIYRKYTVSWFKKSFHL